MATEKSDLSLPKDITNFAATGFFACCANCSTDCGRKRPEAEKKDYLIEDLSYYCKQFTKKD